MSGPTFENDVELNVDGGQIKAAFDVMDARIRAIQRHIETIVDRSAKAAQAFGGSLQGELQKVSKIAGQLDQFYKVVERQQKLDPNFQKREDINKAYALRDKQDMDAQNRKARDVARGTAVIQKEEAKQAQKEIDEVTYASIARRQAAELEADRKVDAARLASRIKNGRETMRADVEGATTLASLENQRLLAANRIGDARRMLGRFGTEEDRQLHAIIAQERERLRLVQAQVNTKNRVTTRDETINAGLNVRGGRNEERALAAQMNLNQAKNRQAELEARIAATIERAQMLSGRAKIDAERALRVDEARLKVTQGRVRELERAGLAEERANRPTAKPNIFGTTGLPGVIARTAAYGGAAQVLFGIQNAMFSSAAFEVQFEDRLAKLASIANATHPEMEQLKADILSIGESSRFSLTDLTDMAEKLAQAGVSVNGMSDALKAVSTLANASGSTPAEAVDLITASLGAFQLQGTEAARVADLMTSALNRTRLTVNQAALAIQYVGTTAYEQNISLEQLLATAGALSQAGIRSGSTIGTGMRQFLVDLQTPSEKLTEQFKRLNISMADVDVKTRGLPAVLETLEQKGFGASQAYGSLETRAAAFYLVAKNNLPLMNQLQMSFADQGAAAAANERAMNSLSAQWARFKNIMAESFDSMAGSMLTTAKNLLMQISDIMDRMHRDAEKYAAQSNDANAPWYRKNLQPYLEAGFEAALNGPAIGNITGGTNGGFGTWLRNLGRDANDATGKMVELEAAMNRTSQATSEQRDKVGALDHEIMRLITQKEALKGKTQQVTAETVNLMSRFDGLSRHITGATGDVNGLISALQGLRHEEAQTLIDNISQQAGALQARSFDAQTGRDQAVTRIRGNSALMNALGVQGRNALNQLGGPNGRVAADYLLRAAEQLAKTNTDWAKLVNQAANNQQTIFSTQGQKGTLETEKALLEAGQTKYGADVAKHMAEVSGAIDRLRVSSNKTKDAASVKQMLDRMEKSIKAMLTRNLRPGDKQFLNNALADISSSRSQISDIMTPSKSADRAADQAAQMISFGSPVAGTPRITSGIGHRKSPGGIGSTDHQGVDIAGKAGDPVYAAADGVVAFAGPRGGYGNLIIIDHGMNTTTRYGHLSVIDVTVGQEVSKGQKIGRIGMTGNATGPHLHFERRLGQKIDRNPLSPRAPGSSAGASDRAQRLLDAEDRRADREALAKERLALSNADDSLGSALKNLKYATTDEMFAAGEKQVDAAFDVWAEQLRKTARAELDRNDATPSEVEARMKEVENQIRQKHEEVVTDVFDHFMKSIQKAVEQIKLNADHMVEPFQLGVAMAQGRLNALNRTSMQGRVPDYVQQTMQRQLGAATDQLDMAQSMALQQQIQDTQALISTKMAEMDAKKGTWNPEQMATARVELDKLGASVADLSAQKVQLDASLNTEGLIPTSFLDNLKMAIENYRQVNQLQASWTEMVSMNLTDALGTAQTSLNDFFNNIASGNMGVIASFKNMVGSVLKYLSQLLIKMAVVKIMQMALGMVGGGGKAPVDASLLNPQVAGSLSYSGGDLSSFLTMLHGGQVKALSGRYISDGVPNRDSVDVKIAKGEFVTRKWAVDSVGVDFMKKLNDHGAAALRDFAPKIVMPPPAQQMMNVWVVKEDQAPPMGPNDVLVTVANDIYNNGPTKQLIKQVAQGA